MCVLTMLLTNVFQALLVKHSDASTSVLVLTMITPASTFCFTLPFLMGKDHTEIMSIVEWIALIVLMIGVVIYRYADVTERKRNGGEGAAGGGGGEGGAAATGGENLDSAASKRDGLSEDVSGVSEVRSRSGGGRNERNDSISSGSRTRPLLMSTRSGIINSEYTGGGDNSDWRSRTGRNISILFEGTELESRFMQESHSSAPLLISRSLPTESGPRAKSAKKAPRLGRSYV